MAGNDNPCLSMAGSTQIFNYGLKIEHKLRIICDILSNFVHEEDHMMIGALLCDILLNKPYKLLYREIISGLCIFTPISGSFLAHEVHIDKRLNNLILNNSESLTLLLPWCLCVLFKLFLEFLKAPFVIQLPFKIGQIRNRSAIALHLIEDFHKHIGDGFLSGTHFCRAL